VAQPRLRGVSGRRGVGGGWGVCTNVLIAVMRQPFSDSLHAICDIGGERLPLLHHLHQLTHAGYMHDASLDGTQRHVTCAATSWLMKFG
jgi:hypothetical protein